MELNIISYKKNLENDATQSTSNAAQQLFCTAYECVMWHIKVSCVLRILNCATQ